MLLAFILSLMSAGVYSAGTVEIVTYYHNDHTGSPVAATDENGNVLWRKEYSPYGEELNKDPKAAGDRRGFTGHVQDQDLGLVYMQARYYDPVIGRFMAIDPMSVNPEASFTFNRYTYGNNNPYKFIDPDGQAALFINSHRKGLSTNDAIQISQFGNEMLEKGVTYGTVAIGPVGAASAAVGKPLLSKAMVSLGRSLTQGMTKSGLTKAQTKTALTTAQKAYKGSTRIGHALSKHAGRKPGVWGNLKGSMKTWNEKAMNHFRDVVRGPGKFELTTDKGNKFLEKRLKDGRGVRLNTDSSFKGFVD